MVVLGGSVFLMSRVPLQCGRSLPEENLRTDFVKVDRVFATPTLRAYDQTLLTLIPQIGEVKMY